MTKIETIGLPFSPAKFVGKPTKLKALKVHMTCGGGMGGAGWDEYIICEDGDLELKPDTFIKVDTNLAKSKQINTRYIVEATPVTLWKLTITNLGNQYMAHGTHEEVLEINCDKLETEGDYERRDDFYRDHRIDWEID